jgi:hypothetical protein
VAGLPERGSNTPESNRPHKLPDLLRCLRADSFARLPSYGKKALLEGLLEMLRQGQEGVVREASMRILGDEPQGIADGMAFPAQLIQKLIHAAISEESEAVRCLLWDVLMKMDAKPEAYIRPRDFVREFWSEEPIGRANVIKFLLDRFKVDEVLEAVDHYVPPGDRRLPVGSCWCLIRYAKTERMVVKKARILRRILDRSEIPAQKATVVYSEVLKALDRFSLIEVFSGRSIDQVPMSWPHITPTQLDLGFATPGNQSVGLSNFRSRLDAIEMVRKQTRSLFSEHS